MSRVLSGLPPDLHLFGGPRRFGQIFRRHIPDGQVVVGGPRRRRSRSLVPEDHRLGVAELDIVANKIDRDPDGRFVTDLTSKLNGEVHPISAVTGSGIKELGELLWQEVKRVKA